MGKADFVEELKNFYMNVVGNGIGIDDMTYVSEDTGYQMPEEFVYVSFPAGAQKRFSVRGDSNEGIFMDFTHFIRFFDDYRWLRQEEWK